MRRCVMLALWFAAYPAGAAAQGFIDDAIVRERDGGGAPQVSTAGLRELLARRSAVVLDARPADEFGLSHIPGALNVAQKAGTPMSVYISDVAEVARLVPDRGRTIVVYCNGPFCGKSRRLARELIAAGYRSVRRYQVGMPGWRATGGVAAIDGSAIHRVAALDRTAVFVDAGMAPGDPVVPRMVTITGSDVERAKDDGRLPMHDHNTRIIVIGAGGEQARAVAEAIAANAFHNVAYYEGDGSALRQATR
jgi:rhodanese-related sulfurtransferase